MASFPTNKNILKLYLSNTKDENLILSGNISSLTEGQIAICNLSGEILELDRTDGAAPTVYDKFRVATVEKGILKQSDVIEYSKLMNKSASTFVAATEKVEYIGYNGTAGSIEVISSNTYEVEIELKNTSAIFGNKRLLKFGVCQSDSTATQTEIAATLVDSLISNFSREPEKKIKFERINSGAAANALGTATCTVVNGSKSIVFNEDMTALVVAGTVLRMGGLGAGTTPCYVVASTDGGAGANRIYFLDVPYQGISATLAANTVESVTSVNWGIKLTGLPNIVNRVTRPYDKSDWRTTLKDFGTTPVTIATAVSKGNGTYEEVAEIEYKLWGNSTNAIRLGVPPVEIPQNALYEAGKGYDLVAVQWYDQSTESTVSNDNKSYKQIIIATHSDNNAKAHADLKTVFGIS